MFDKLISQGGVVESAGRVAEAEARAWLAAKRASHLAHGWTVRDIPDGFEAEKAYVLRSTKTRTVYIQEVPSCPSGSSGLS